MRAASRMKMAIVVAILAGAGLPPLWSCSQTAEQHYETRLADTGKPALHAVHNDRLRELMGAMGGKALDQLPQEMEPGLASGPNLDEVSAIATSLAKTARELPAVGGDAGLSEQDRNVFDALCKKLDEEATALATCAKRQDPAGARAKLDQIISTCNACHSQFRFSGE